MKKISSPSLENLTLKSTLAPPPISTPILPCLVPIRDFDVTKALAGRKWRKPPPPSRKFVKFVEQATLSLSSTPSSFDHETRGNRWTNGRRSRGENGMRRKLRTCPRVRRAWPGRKSELPVRNSDSADQMRDEEFFLRSACSTRASRKLKFLFRLQIFVVSPRFTYPYIDREREREDRWLEFRIRVSRRDIGFIFFFLRGRGLFGIFVRVLAPSRNLFPLE